MPGLLKAPQHEQWQQVADVEAIGRGIETGVNGARLFRQPFAEAFIGRLMNEAAPLKIFYQHSQQKDFEQEVTEETEMGISECKSQLQIAK
jgi:hypothetical protein